MKIKTKEAQSLYQTNLDLLEKLKPSLTDKQIKKFIKAAEYLIKPSNEEEYDIKKLCSKLQKIEWYTKKSGTLKMIDDFLDYCETTFKP